VISSLALAAVARSAGRKPQSPPPTQRRVAGHERSPLADLEEALRLAEPGGYVRVFLDQGLPMQTLLAQWLACSGDSPLRGYAGRLLSQFDAEPRTAGRRDTAASPAGLVEPLSPREMEVLHLMALGRTNAEIARQLIVAPGTVKAHTASIYQKLDAANRTEAVARARQIGILS
jgi:LuxR family maltose regulon positive regulatory protein